MVSVVREHIDLDKGIFFLYDKKVEWGDLMLYDRHYVDKDGNLHYAKWVEDIPKDDILMNNENPTDESSDSEIEEFDEISDSFIPKDCKYLNRLDLVQFNNYTERFRALNHFVRSFIPHMGDLNRSGTLLYEDAVPKNVQEALSRGLIAALIQMGRIANKDLEPINMISPEIDTDGDTEDDCIIDEFNAE